MNKVAKLNLSVLLILIIGLLASVFAVLTFRSVQGSAREDVAQTSQAIMSLSNPRIDSQSDLIYIDVYASCVHNQCMEANIVLSYDPQYLSPKPKQYISHLFKVMANHSSDEGIMDISLFSSPARDEPMLYGAASQKIATLVFEKNHPNIDETMLELVFTAKGDLSDSNLIQLSKSGRENPKDLLSSVKGIRLKVE